jgi:ADP-ribose pyrophosphatase YjhB (NUDIX family)
LPDLRFDGVVRLVQRKPTRRRSGTVKRVLRSLFVRARAMIEGRQADRWSSAGGVVVDGNTVALIRQKKKWTLPKGRVDPGESISRAALREVLEETGLRASVVEYLGVAESEKKDTHWFLMALEGDEGHHDDEVDEIRFVKPGKARKLLDSRKDRLVLERALAALDGRPPKDPRID